MPWVTGSKPSANCTSNTDFFERGFLIDLSVQSGNVARITRGVLAQLVERLNGIEEVRGSNPLGSTS